MPPHKLIELKEKLASKGSFGHNVLTLMTGTAVGQAIPLAVAPFLTRLYTPAEFGIFGLYMAVVSIISVAATGHYEAAITLPKEEDKAADLFLLTIGIAAALSLILFFALIFLKGRLAVLLKIEGGTGWFYFIPAAVLLTGVFEALNSWLIRQRMFKDLSLRRVAQYGSMAVFQIIFGLEGLRATGLIMGYFFGQVCGYGLLAFRVWKHDHASFMAVRIESMKEQAKRFKNFPILSVPARVINELANKLPYILLNNSFGSAVVGLFDLPMRILEAPLSLLSRSVLDVFKERASRDYRTKGECRVIFLKTLKALILVSVVPFVLIFIFSPKIIPFIFGENWITAGTYTRILSIMFMLKFISAPMSYVLYIAEKQFVNLIWQIILLLFTVTAMYVGGVLNNPLISILLFSIMYTIMYGIHIYLGFRFSKSQASG